MISLLNTELNQPSRIFLIFLLCIALVYLGVYNYDLSAPGRYAASSIGDWLINYAGGFVRRGLSGSIILPVASFINIRPELIVMMVKMALHTCVYMGMGLFILRCKSLKIIDAFIVFSPALLLFPILSLSAGGRKENFLLVWAVINLLRAHQGKEPPRDAITSLLFLLFTIIHEGLIFFLPITLLATQQIYRLSTDIKKIALIMLPSCVYAGYLIFFTNPIDKPTMEAIAKAIDPVNYEPWMKRAILHLSENMSDGIAWVQKGLTEENILAMIGGLLLTIAPFFLLQKSNRFYYYFKRDLPLFFLAWAWQLPIFIIAVDWGRWLYINNFMMCIYAFSRYTADKDSSSSIKLKRSDWYQLLILVSALTLWIGMWTLRNCCPIGARPGFLLKPIIAAYCGN